MIILPASPFPVHGALPAPAERDDRDHALRMVAGIDRIEGNRIRLFVAEGRAHELQRRQSLDCCFPELPTRSSASPPASPLGWRIGPRPCPEGRQYWLDPRRRSAAALAAGIGWQVAGTHQMSSHEPAPGRLVLVESGSRPSAIHEPAPPTCPVVSESAVIPARVSAAGCVRSPGTAGPRRPVSGPGPRCGGLPSPLCPGWIQLRSIR